MSLKKYLFGGSKKSKKNIRKKATGSSSSNSSKSRSNSSKSNSSKSRSNSSNGRSNSLLKSPSKKEVFKPTRSNLNNIDNTVRKEPKNTGKLVKELHRDVFNFIRTELKNMSGDKAIMSLAVNQF